MKKQYVKPDISFDTFELSQSIAGGCEGITNAVYGTCATTIPDLGFSIFANKHTCDVHAAPGNNEFVCYHAPSDSNNVFSS